MKRKSTNYDSPLNQYELLIYHMKDDQSMNMIYSNYCCLLPKAERKHPKLHIACIL